MYDHEALERSWFCLHGMVTYYQGSETHYCYREQQQFSLLLVTEDRIQSGTDSLGQSEPQEC